MVWTERDEAEGYTDWDKETGDPLPVKNLTTGERHTADGYGAIQGDELVYKPRSRKKWMKAQSRSH